MTESIAKHSINGGANIIMQKQSCCNWSDIPEHLTQEEIQQVGSFQKLNNQNGIHGIGTNGATQSENAMRYDDLSMKKKCDVKETLSATAHLLSWRQGDVLTFNPMS